MSDTAAAPKEKKAPAKPRAKPEHPGFSVMAVEAITALKEVSALGPRQGSKA